MKHASFSARRWNGGSGVSRSAALQTSDRGWKNRSRVRGENLHTGYMRHPLTSVTFWLFVYMETLFSTLENRFQSGAFSKRPSPRFHVNGMGLSKFVKAIKNE